MRRILAFALFMSSSAFGQGWKPLQWPDQRYLLNTRHVQADSMDGLGISSEEFSRLLTWHLHKPEDVEFLQPDGKTLLPRTAEHFTAHLWDQLGTPPSDGQRFHVQLPYQFGRECTRTALADSLINRAKWQTILFPRVMRFPKPRGEPLPNSSAAGASEVMNLAADSTPPWFLPISCYMGEDSHGLVFDGPKQWDLRPVTFTVPERDRYQASYMSRLVTVISFRFVADDLGRLAGRTARHQYRRRDGVEVETGFWFLRVTDVRMRVVSAEGQVLGVWSFTYGTPDVVRPES